MTPTLSSVAMILVNFINSPGRTNRMDSERNNCGADATNGINFISFSALD
jgi:hypothetical protein